MKKPYIISIIGIAICFVYNTVIEIIGIEITNPILNLMVFIIALVPFELLLMTLSKDERIKPVIRKIAFCLFWVFLGLTVFIILGKIIIAIKTGTFT